MRAGKWKRVCVRGGQGESLRMGYVRPKLTNPIWNSVPTELETQPVVVHITAAIRVWDRPEAPPPLVGSMPCGFCPHRTSPSYAKREGKRGRWPPLPDV
ncbi:hypothetical protein B296_00057396 [Ensete ventricosum]|uniref:Uncharacterized protein n=1 Tax=Ensete ventricosum TaxID=4639 RepID=A0A426XRF8_ENSVE|nr:hypothetical protein B296_00057396 [Ensete ventricosum]